MSILFAANGEADDGLTGVVQITTANLRPNGYARACYGLNGAGQQLVAALDAPQTRFAFKTYWSQTTNSGISAQQWCAEIRSGATTRLRVHPDTTQGGFALRIEKVDGATVETVLLTPPFLPTPTANGVLTFLLNIDINYTASGYIRVFIDEGLVAEFVGDPRSGGGTNLDTLVLRSMRNISLSWSEARFTGILIANDSLWAVNLVTLSPNAAGALNQWTGAHTDINNVGTPNANFIASAVADQQYLFNYTDPAAGIGTFEVLDIIVRSLVSRGAEGPQSFQQQVRSGTETAQGPSHVLGTGYTMVEDHWTVDPNGGVPWTRTSLNALQAGGVSKA